MLFRVRALVPSGIDALAYHGFAGHRLSLVRSTNEVVLRILCDRPKPIEARSRRSRLGRDIR